MWDVRTGQGVCHASLGSEILSLSFNRGSSHIAAGFVDGWCRVYDASGLGEATSLRPHDTEVRSLCFAQEQSGEVLFTGSFDGSVAVSDAESGDLLQRMEGHSDRVVQAAPHPERPWLLSCSVDKTLRLWM
uniref:Uncharacterized protein n=2 Tax=Hemiselmis andersenii TaxID=464988 RepID=A0A6T8KUR7_HEMAN